MIVATSDDDIVGGAIALHLGDAVKVDVVAVRADARSLYLGGANAENRGFYWRLGYTGRRSLMQKALPSRSSSW